MRQTAGNPVLSKPTTEVFHISSRKIIKAKSLPENLWVTQSKLTAEYSILDASFYEIYLVEVANIILHNHEGKFKIKQKRIVGEIWFRHGEELAEYRDDYVG